MAQLKIYDPQVQAQSGQVPNISTLQLPMSIATDMATETSKIGKVVAEIYKEQKEKEDNNTLFKIISEVSPDISAITTETSKFTDVKKGFEYFTTTVKDKNFLDRYPDINSNVKTKFNDWMVKQQLQLLPTLSAQISKNSIETTQIVDDQFLTNANLKRAANNPVDQTVGEREFTQFFNDPTRIKTYGVKELEDLKRKKEDQSAEFRLMYQTKNNAYSILQNRDAIISQFGEQRGNIYLERAKTTLVSEEADRLRLNEHKKAATISEQIGTYSELSLRINNYNADPSNQKYVKELPSLDYLNDLKKFNQINTAQYNSLLEAWTGKQKFSDPDLMNAISAQIAVAKSVTDIDTIQSMVNLNPDIIRRLNIKDVDGFNKIFEKHKNDREAHNEDKYYRKLLETDLGAINGIVVLNKSAAQTEEKRREIQGINIYNEYVNSGLSPEKSYLKTLKEIDKRNIPKFKDLQQPETVKIDPNNFALNHKKELEDTRIFLSGRYKAGSIDIEKFKRDLSRIDFIENVQDLRVNLGLIDKVSANGVMPTQNISSSDVPDKRKTNNQLIK
jgi:hypothetical protein